MAITVFAPKGGLPDCSCCPATHEECPNRDASKCPALFVGEDDQKNWIDEEIDFYDFIWAYGVKAHTKCINDALVEDIRKGGKLFEEMKNKILEQFPTREIAMKAFREHNEP